MDPITKNMLEVINEEKESLGMSNAELARRIQVSELTVGKALRGERKLSGPELIKITWCLDIEWRRYYPEKLIPVLPRRTRTH